jgi:hypothetical protein
MRHRSPAPVIGSLIAAAVVIGLPFVFWGHQLQHGLTRAFTSGAYVAIPLIVGAIVLLVAIVGWSTDRRAIGWSAGTVFVLGGLATVAFAWVPHNYQVDRLYVGDVKTINHTAPSFGERTPFDIASTSSSKNLGNTTGTAVGVKSLNDEGDHGLWNALVIRRGFGVGYESVQVQDIPLYGEATPSDVKTCNFDRDSKLRLGGVLWGNDLRRAIYAKTPSNVTFDDNDAYGFCDKGTSKVVVPLTEVNGFWTASENFYGDAVYDGKTGKLSITQSEKTIGALPGPVYPQSLAATQRSALRALGSFSDYWFDRAGYSDTSDDDGNPDSFNPTEMGLRQQSTGHATYVTPLTPPGSSTSVVALSVVDASIGAPGDRNHVQVFKYDKSNARQANSSVASSIKQNSSWLTGWASGLKIFEIVPAKKDEWVASIGQSQGVVYRAVVNADGKSTLFDEDGNVVTSTGTHAAADSKPSAGSTAGATNGDLSKMTPNQLQDLATQVLAELAKRADK